jgi:hypothetical protein
MGQMMKMTLGNMLMLMLMMLLTSCNSTECMKDYYKTNKTSLIQMKTLSDALADAYTFERITIMKKSSELELMFHGGSGNNVTMYLNLTDLSLISEHPVDECDPAVLQRFRTMYQNSNLRQILNLFEQIDPKAIKITHVGIFVALGKPLKHMNVNLDGGILMTFEPGFTDRTIVEEIDTNVYLYDTLVY